MSRFGRCVAGGGASLCLPTGLNTVVRGLIPVAVIDRWLAGIGHGPRPGALITTEWVTPVTGVVSTTPGKRIEGLSMDARAAAISSRWCPARPPTPSGRSPNRPDPPCCPMNASPLRRPYQILGTATELARPAESIATAGDALTHAAEAMTAAAQHLLNAHRPSAARASRQHRQPTPAPHAAPSTGITRRSSAPRTPKVTRPSTVWPGRTSHTHEIRCSGT
jgi:hypothetical protein